MVISMTTPQTLILNAKKIILTTHRNSDGDGIGSLVALYWGFQNLNKHVLFAPVDEVPNRYSYMLENVNSLTQFDQVDADLLIILDTNQGELCNPLYQILLEKNCPILFIDHHKGEVAPSKKVHQLIVLEAASTGEIVYDLIKSLKIPITDLMATALYSSLTFDTQAFKLVKNSAKSHAIAAELAEYKINTEKIQRALFAHWTPLKMKFLAELILSATYYSQAQIVGLKVSLEQLLKYNMHGDYVNDLLDLFTLIPTLKFAFIIRQVSHEEFKISFRSSLTNYAFLAALNLGGGGHASSAGVWMKAINAEKVEELVLKELNRLELIAS